MIILYKFGSRGEVVKQIQRALHLIEDGIYGRQTEEAVRAFQREHGLKADGIVGPATLAFLIPQRWKKSKRLITEIIVHCTATPEGRDYTVAAIRADHIKQGWSDIGYHYVIYRDGSIHEGRDVDKQGAHCAINNHNRNSIGIAYVGGVENKPGVPYAKQKSKDTRTLRQKAALLNLLGDLKKIYPNAKIYGHHDFEPKKDCPCFDAKSEYKNI
jgi:N-acetylmuramoyl-L-alanine amidase